MKIYKITILALFISGSVYAAEHNFYDELNKRGISYVVTSQGVSVVDATDPTTVCEIADKYPEAKIRKVINLSTKTEALCEIP